MDLWTIYDHPKDYPDTCVARRWTYALGDLDMKPTDDLRIGPLEELRAFCQSLGLIRIERQPGDDPVILETWL